MHESKLHVKPPVESWAVVSKKAFWDRNVELQKWRQMVSQAHRSYLPGAVDCFSAVEFVNFYGSEKFVEDWPSLRASLSDDLLKKVGVYDLTWSQLAGGGWNLKPSVDFHAMPKRRKEFLMMVAKGPGKCIYEIAKILDMQYRRAYDHATFLLNEGKIKAVESNQDGRRKTKLYPISHIVNTTYPETASESRSN